METDLRRWLVNVVRRFGVGKRPDWTIEGAQSQVLVNCIRRDKFLVGRDRLLRFARL